MIRTSPRQTMHAVEIVEVGKSRIIEMNRPTPASREVQIRVLANGICGSDIAAYLGNHPYRIPPVVTGHEPVGVVTELGEGTDGFRIGEMVVIEPHAGCGECEECRKGRYNICRNKRVLGTPAWPGSFAEYILAPTGCVYSVDGVLTEEQAALIEPLTVATHSVRRAELTGNERIAVLGCGPIGLMHVLALGEHTPRSLICADIKDFNLKIAEQIGATHCFNPRKHNIVHEVDRLTRGEGLDVSFVVFHSAELVQLAIDMAKPGGTVVLVASFPNPLPISFQRVQLAELKLLGTAMYTRDDYVRSIKYAQSLGKRLTRLITHRIGLAAVPEYLDLLSRGALEDAVKVVIEMH